MQRPLSLAPAFGLAALVPLLLLGCSKSTQPVQPHGNYPPAITAMSWRPTIVHAWELITVQCSTRDLNNDPLTYAWDASAGGFPSGTTLPAVAWRSPATFRPSVVRVTVSDGKDQVARDTTITISRMAPATGLVFVNGASSVDLRWGGTPDAGLDGFSGYEIFAGPRSFLSLPVDSAMMAYRLTRQPLTRQHYIDTLATPGQIRYYFVLARRDYEGVTERAETGPEIDTAARPDGYGDLPLYEVQSPNHHPMGVRLSDGTLQPIDPNGRDQVDLYLGRAEAQDRSGELRLKSPSLLAYRDPAWADRVTSIWPIGSDLDAWSVPVPPDTSAVQEISVTINGVYAIRTADGHYGKIQISSLGASAPNTFSYYHWAWQPILNYPRF